MRLHIRFQLEETAILPIDHNHELLGLVYRLLAKSDEEYAAFLHGEGYREQAESPKRSKLYTFSGLRVEGRRRHIENGRLVLRPGPVDWLIASARSDFLTHSATGLLTIGSIVRVGTARLRLETVEALPQPSFTERTNFSCLSPIVAAQPCPDNKTYYLRPTDPEFSEAIRANLLWKHRLLHGTTPEDDRLDLQFDTAYLADPRHRGGTKLVTFKNIQIVGAFAPFTLTGSTALMETAWNCGLGEKNSIGLGMIDLKSSPRSEGTAE